MRLHDQLLAMRVGGFLSARTHRPKRGPRNCPASSWVVTHACVDRLGKGIQACPLCSAPVRCTRVDRRDVQIPPHRSLSAVVVKAVSP